MQHMEKIHHINGMNSSLASAADTLTNQKNQ